MCIFVELFTLLRRCKVASFECCLSFLRDKAEFFIVLKFLSVTKCAAQKALNSRFIFICGNEGA